MVGLTMSVNIEQIENNLKSLSDVAHKTFVFYFLRAYSPPQATIARLSSSNLNKAKIAGELICPNKLYFKPENKHDLYDIIDTLKKDGKIKND